MRTPETVRRSNARLLAASILTAACALPWSFLAVAQEAHSRDSDGPFVDASGAAGIAMRHRGVWDPDADVGYLGMGQAWGDYDNDGWIDLYLTGNLEPNALLRNRGDGTFEPAPHTAHVALAEAVSGGALWGDYDNDGWTDLYVLNHGPNVLFRNDGGRGFIDATAAAGVGDAGKGQSATWGDYDGDGDLDLYVVNWSCAPQCDPETLEASRDRLYRNEGDGTFSDATASLGDAKTLGAGFAASFFDYDGDGDADLYVVNDKYRNPIGNVLWRNEGPGCGSWCWVDVSEEAGAAAVMHGMGLAVGDYDGDLTPDVYASNMMGPMMLLRNAGGGAFADTTWDAGVGINPPGTAVGWGAAFLDYDNDGWLDLYLATTGMPKLSSSFYGGKQPDMENFLNPYPDALFRNAGNATFAQVAAPDQGDSGRATMGLAYADYDHDGFVDLVAGIWNEGYALYRNESLRHDPSAATHRWLTVELTGGGPVNHDAVGALVTVVDAGGRMQAREVISGSSFGASHDLRLHFGLGDAEPQEVRVRWPDGRETTHRDLESNRILRLAYPSEGDDRP